MTQNKKLSKTLVKSSGEQKIVSVKKTELPKMCLNMIVKNEAHIIE